MVGGYLEKLGVRGGGGRNWGGGDDGWRKGRIVVGVGLGGGGSVGDGDGDEVRRDRGKGVGGAGGYS